MRVIMLCICNSLLCNVVFCLQCDRRQSLAVYLLFTGVSMHIAEDVCVSLLIVFILFNLIFQALLFVIDIEVVVTA